MSPSGWASLKREALEHDVPLVVHLELTRACNLNCVFCCTAQTGEAEAPLSLAEWSTVLADLRSLGCLILVLTGGEPLVHPHFREVLLEARQRGFAVRLFTNGTLVDREMAQELGAVGLLAVELSLHGATAETHDRTTGAPGSFDAVWRAVDLLREAGLRVLLKTPLSRLNEHKLGAVTALAQQRGVPLRLDPAIIPRDDGRADSLCYSAGAEATEELFGLLAAEGELRPADRPPGGTNCGVGRLTMAIDPEGRVYPCVRWRHESLGSVREDSLRDIWLRSPVRLDAARTAREASLLLRQQGGPASRHQYCPAIAARTTGDPLRPDRPFLERAAAADRCRRGVQPRRSPAGA